MTEYTMRSRTIACRDQWDVVVAGGGPAGCAAAAAAARAGAKTLLVEATGALGGMGTSGMVPAWCPFSDREKIIYRGIAQEVFEQTKAGMPHVQFERLDWVPIDPERLKRVYDTLVTEAGVSVLFNTFVVDVDVSDGKMNTMLAVHKGGFEAFSASYFIDCTGDADLVFKAGLPCEKGDEHGELQPVTHCFALANVDIEAYRRGPSLKKGDHPLIKDILASGKFPLIRDGHACNNQIGPGVIGFNAGHIWDIDNTDPYSISRALIEGRTIAEEFRAALAEFNPAAFGDSFVVQTAPLMGVRETRRIIGDYVLTVEDYFARRDFPDEICRNAYPIDIHTSKAELQKVCADVHDVMKRYERYSPGESHGIPLRCLLPRGLSNVLVAGRSISTDRIVQGSTRVMPVCLAMGEAAGTAAAMAASQGAVDIRAVSVAKLRTKLASQGAYLPEPSSC